MYHYTLYWSQQEQSYTLMETNSNQLFLLEEDSKPVHFITALDWDDAVAQQGEYLKQVNND